MVARKEVKVFLYVMINVLLSRYNEPGTTKVFTSVLASLPELVMGQASPSPPWGGVLLFFSPCTSLAKGGFHQIPQVTVLKLLFL